MNTYSHLLQTLALARRARPGDTGLAVSAAAGAVLPDLPYTARAARLLAASRGKGLAGVLAGLDYGGETSWPPDLLLHSFLPAAALGAASRAPLPPRARQHLAAFAAGLAGHAATDVLTHHSDARPPLWPLSRRRWHSPVSTWERGRHAAPAAVAEHLLTAAAAALLITQARTTTGDSTTGAGGSAGAGSDLLAFAGRFLRHPAAMGAVVPTSRRAVAAMLDLADLSRAHLVVELGAGTGAFTRQLLDRTGPGCEVLALEKDPVLHARLAARLTDPRLTLVCADAADLAGHLNGRHAAAVISAVPFTSMRASTRFRILAQAADALAPGGVMLAIQYSAARQADLARVFTSVRRTYFPANVPPAFLYECTAPYGISAGLPGW